ncbi:hypothetical protein PPO43_04085 [Saprospira sp. CCB-QB6]|uniref:hypothetical protein n=1 Tax=Saprospira sp. CCB-QB6 TaxID=3023936 RepID=UPI002349D115|nr:hypothetical protein [Saprospira sp. CCB-QB6]WCL82281.1 hypothetical protein PPO43_04085 [Saprospira sp. CCB-QB6]
MSYKEKLPEDCPPPDANAVNGKTFYRLGHSSSIVEKDFFSHRKLFPNKKFNTTECIACSLSVFSEKFRCDNLKKLPAHKKKVVFSVELFPKDGLIKQTGRYKEHHSWWMSTLFNIESSKVL